MNIRFVLIILISLFTTANAAPTPCNKSDTPTVVKPMENWDIIATNTGKIDMGPVFGGTELTYTVSAHPKNSKNKVDVDKKTGVIQVKAERKDKFDVTVKAKNRCGAVSNTFNVIIDEEE